MRCYVFLHDESLLTWRHYNTFNGSRLTGLTCSQAPGFWMVERQLVLYSNILSLIYVVGQYRNIKHSSIPSKGILKFCDLSIVEISNMESGCFHQWWKTSRVLDMAYKVSQVSTRSNGFLRAGKVLGVRTKPPGRFSSIQVGDQVSTWATNWRSIPCSSSPPSSVELDSLIFFSRSARQLTLMPAGGPQIGL